MSLTDRAATAANKPLKLEGPVSSSVSLLLMLVACHFFLDLVATVVLPVWPRLETHFRMSGGVLWLYVIWSMTTSFSQLLFGYLSDRHSLRWMIWAGPAAAVVCLSAIGLTRSPVIAVLLLIGGGLGVAAFHPEAAATAGACAPGWRSRAMSVFAMGGYLGQAIGPTYSGVITDRFSLTGLAWTIAWGLPLLLLLAAPVSLAPTPPSINASGAPPAGLFRRHWKMMLLVLAIGSLRVTPAMGAPLALAFLLHAEGASSSYVGYLQSAFMAGIGGGGCLCALFMRPRYERLALWSVPFLAAPLFAVIPWLESWPQFVPTLLAGVATGFSMPILISSGQQLFPEGQRVASSLTMGVSWGVGGAVVAAAMAIFKASDIVRWVFLLFALSSCASGALTRLLPKAAEDDD